MNAIIDQQRQDKENLYSEIAPGVFERFCCILVPLARSDTNRVMTKQQRAAGVRQDQSFKGRQFTAEVILWAVRWYLMFPISYRDLELMLLDRGVEVDHTTIFRWTQIYAVEQEKLIRPHLRMSNGSWRVDETFCNGLSCVNPFQAWCSKISVLFLVFWFG